MNLIKISISIFALSLFLYGVCFSGEEEVEGLPKIGFVKNDGADVKAGDNINFENLCKLKKGDPLKVIGKRYSWFKITLPKKAYLYIKNDFVDLIPNKDIGVVNAVQVNLRAGPDTKYAVLGKVSKQDELKVLSEENSWYRIEPPKGTTGWIHSSQIGFSLEEIN